MTTTPIHQAALFDMDGLLIDSERAIMGHWLAVAQAAGVALTPDDYLAVVGRSASDSATILSTAFGGRARFERARAAVERAIETSTGFALKAGVRELLEWLTGRGIACAVASSSSRREIEMRLGAVGVLRHFGAIAGGDEVARAKPDPAVYLLAAQRLGVAAADCLAFEDSHNGARAALASGARLVLVPDLLAASDELAAQSLAVLVSLHDARDRVERWFST